MICTPVALLEQKRNREGQLHVGECRETWLPSHVATPVFGIFQIVHRASICVCGTPLFDPAPELVERTLLKTLA